MKVGEIRFSDKSLRILKVFVESPTAQYSGAELLRMTGIPSGTLYPILIRFEEEGLLISAWEEINPKEAGRPRRRLYRVTDAGAQKAHQVLRDLALTGFGSSPVLNPAG